MIPNETSINQTRPKKRMKQVDHIIAMGIEGSANKVGVGIIKFSKKDGTSEVLSNPRKTYITPPGEGFQPRDTSWHHQRHIVALVQLALAPAKLTPGAIDCICFTTMI